MDTSIETAELIKPHFTIKQFPKSSPDLVADYSKSPEQPEGQVQISHEQRHPRADDRKNIIDLHFHVLTAGKIHSGRHDHAEEQANGDQNLRLRKHPRILGVLAHLAQLTLD